MLNEMLDASVLSLSLSIFFFFFLGGGKSAEMAITFGGMLSEDQKVNVAKDI